MTVSSSRPNVTVSPNTDAVSASVSGVAWWKTPCATREVRVQAVAELVREREHVMIIAEVDDEHLLRFVALLRTQGHPITSGLVGHPLILNHDRTICWQGLVSEPRKQLTHRFPNR